MTILVIDDSRFIQLAMEKALRDVGYRVVLTSDGESGLRTAIQSPPDVILLDVMLPSLPGTSVLRGLKHNPVTAHIPVIVLTGLTRLDEARLRSEGADGYMAKADLDPDHGCLHLLEEIRKVAKQALPVRG